MSITLTFELNDRDLAHFREAGERARKAAQGRSDLVSQWAGQAAALARHDDAADVFAELAAGLPR